MFNDPTNEVIPNVDVFHPSMILMAFGECDRRLVVRIQGSRGQFDVEKLLNEGTKPEGFL